MWTESILVKCMAAIGALLDAPYSVIDKFARLRRHSICYCPKRDAMVYESLLFGLQENELWQRKFAI